ncbi:uncharacterized protein SCHCODRAFT_02255155 [Schizophyllum commune H4-8]|uniref:uncharacterized protein n=1 Tax=Schizophyllum commune (strain H4-8 / FGSC 9210) TaxID=578458 RepID=UPI00215F76B4|nr:uncharacterized protein SCHCODRAFT_02255155 [Schizophyllum commune H4-8]KAI5893521.1 hypothetical protein SCHCODRAFT_02255155 [Schizophyllum commune H4-8]
MCPFLFAVLLLLTNRHALSRPPHRGIRCLYIAFASPHLHLHTYAPLASHTLPFLCICIHFHPGATRWDDDSLWTTAARSGWRRLAVDDDDRLEGNTQDVHVRYPYSFVQRRAACCDSPNNFAFRFLACRFIHYLSSCSLVHTFLGLYDASGFYHDLVWQSVKAKVSNKEAQWPS